MAYSEAFGDIFMKVLDSLANQEESSSAGISINKSIPIINAVCGGFGAVDVSERDNTIQLFFDLPGVQKSDIKLEINKGYKNNVLRMTVSRMSAVKSDSEHYKTKERYTGTKTREVPLPLDIDSGSITASYVNGVLNVSIKKVKQEMPSKTIPIN